MTHIKLVYSGTEYAVRATGVTIGGRTNTYNTPNANGTAAVEVQTQSFENPTYSIQGIHFVEGSTNLSYTNLLSMYKHKYTGSNPIYLLVKYEDTDLVASDGTSTSIPVVMSGFNFPIKTNESRDGYMPVGSATFIETK